MKRSQPSLRPLADLYGLQRSYRAASGETVQSGADAMVAVIRALSGEPDADLDALLERARGARWTRVLEPVFVAWNGRLDQVVLHLSAAAARGRISYDLTLEAGDVISDTIPSAQRGIRGEEKLGRTRFVELACALDVQLPLGYHQLDVQTGDGDARALIIAAPRRCHDADRPREWGVFAPLYALRRSKHEPIGDFSDLEALMHWIGDLDGDVVATLPISASFLRAPFDSSPYSPASRLFWNELYVTLDPLHQSDAIKRAARSDLVDYRLTADGKRAQLEKQADKFFKAQTHESREFRKFLKLYPEARRYAQFRAAGERYHAGWPSWPARERSGKLGGWNDDDAVARYHLYAQYVAHTQLAQLAQSSGECGVRLYLDLPLGVHPDGYDVWRDPALFVTGVAAGAPPDPFFTKGQDWGFPPLSPRAMRDEGYRYWRAVVQTQLRYAGILRLDHVMGLHRLYWVPRGLEATQGVYVRYPAEELYAVLALESMRHEAMIVGEDLGTVPAEVRQAMSRHNVKRMFVVQFEATDHPGQPLPPVPQNAVASLNTHDMPPFHAYWEGLDADLRHDLGLLDENGVQDARMTRRRTARALSRLLGSEQVLVAEWARNGLLDYLSASDADMVLVNLEDLWLETEQQNVPGTSQERPNWRRRLRYTLDQIRQNAQVRAQLDAVERERRTKDDSHS